MTTISNQAAGIEPRAPQQGRAQITPEPDMPAVPENDPTPPEAPHIDPDPSEVPQIDPVPIQDPIPHQVPIKA
ncbi:MAG TPA: hypothetical protein VGP06_08465 [Janthinobacterium sp.]|jgi:hypothetical protein|nr:hypothetical protein [Janthinobacterium sp.]